MPSTNALNRALTKKTPEAFGRYNLLGRIAVGGMAEVYVARCGEFLGLQTLIALKRILPIHAADDKFVQMFQREASIALRLQHRSIARVFEVGKVNEDWFLSMELVQGENLARVTDALEERGLRWDPNLIAFIGAEMAMSLHYAHTLKDARGRPLRIVHRDVSPENIMLGFDGSVKIIDFGIALCESYASLTTQGAVRGKVQYVSPEQAQTHKLDGRSDVFSLGVVLYECLAGNQPFERTSPMATLDDVVNKSLPPIPHVSPQLNDAIIKALEKDPNHRYESGEAFATALLGAIAGQDANGPAKVSQLVTALFPQRLKRWRQIQDMAGEGFGFREKPANDQDVSAPIAVPPPPLPDAHAFDENADTQIDDRPPDEEQAPDPRQATKVEKYYVVSGTAESLGNPPRKRRRLTAPLAGLGAAVFAAVVAILLLGDPSGASLQTRAEVAPLAPRISPLEDPVQEPVAQVDEGNLTAPVGEGDPITRPALPDGQPAAAATRSGGSVTKGDKRAGKRKALKKKRKAKRRKGRTRR
jgi:serine/threonine protein kinase